MAERKIAGTANRTEDRVKAGARRALDSARSLQFRNPVDPTNAKVLSRFLSMPTPVVLAGGLGASLISSVMVTKVADGVLSRQTKAFDHNMLHLARGARHSGKKPLDPIMSLLSAAGEPRALYPITSLLAAKWLMEERADDAVTLVIGLVGSAGINGALKHIVRRPRPLWKLPIPRSGYAGTSFPSNHATMTLATYGTMAFLLSRRRNTKPNGKSNSEENEIATGHKGRRLRRSVAWIWAPVLLLCGLIGWSRVYQGVHNPSDVLGGWLAGGVWLLTCIAAASRSGITNYRTEANL